MSDPFPPLHLSYDDNRLLALLFGQHDVHLARIEQRLGVLIRARGSDVAISGPPDSVAAARVVLGLEVQAVRQAMRRLPHEQREALALSLLSGLTHTEIAALLGQPLGTVKTRVRLGLRKLRAALAPESQAKEAP